MLRYFKKYSVGGLVFTVLFVIIFFVINLLRPNFSDNSSNLLNISNVWIKTIISLFAYVIVVMMINYYTSKYSLFKSDSLIAGFIFILLAVYTKLQLSIFLLILPVLIIGVSSTLININKPNSYHFFNLGILFALVSIIYHPFIVFFIFGITASLYSKSKLSKDIILFILGFGIIYLMYFELSKLVGFTINFNLQFTKIKIITNLFDKIYFTFLGLVFIISSSDLLSKINTKEIEKRIIYGLFFIFFLNTILLFFIDNNKSTFVILFFPISVLFGNFFIFSKKKFIKGFLFNLLIILSLIYIIFD